MATRKKPQPELETASAPKRNRRPTRLEVLFAEGGEGIGVLAEIEVATGNQLSEYRIETIPQHVHDALLTYGLRHLYHAHPEMDFATWVAKLQDGSLVPVPVPPSPPKVLQRDLKAQALCLADPALDMSEALDIVTAPASDPRKHRLRAPAYLKHFAQLLADNADHLK